MKKASWITVAVLLMGWFMAAAALNNEFILPMPQDVLKQMLVQCTSFSFYGILWATFFRMAVGLILALAAAFITALVSGMTPWFRNLFSPVRTLIQTIPNISYIIVILIWLGSETSVTVISFLILFPIFYSNILLAFDNLDSELQDVSRLYPDTWFSMVFKIYLPEMVPYLISALKTAFGLGFKVSVMAEILGQVHQGIGKQLYLARINLDMASLFAWTIWIILLSVVMDRIFDWFLKQWRTPKRV